MGPFSGGATRADTLNRIVNPSEGLGGSRIFREPVLKALAHYAREDERSEGEGLSINNFWLRLYGHRESLQSKDIEYCLRKLTDDNPEDHYLTLKNLLGQLDKLSGDDRWKALFAITDKVLERQDTLTKDQKKYLLGVANSALQKSASGNESLLPQNSSNRLFDEVKSICRSRRAFADLFLKKGILNQERGVSDQTGQSHEPIPNEDGILPDILLLKCILDFHANAKKSDFELAIRGIQFVLSRIPSECRWSLLAAYAPELFDSAPGIYALAEDPGCREEIVRYLDERFSGTKEFDEKVRLSSHMVRCLEPLCRHEAGMKFCKKVGSWVVRQSPVTLADEATPDTVDVYRKTLMVFLEKAPSEIISALSYGLQKSIPKHFDALIDSLQNRSAEDRKNHCDYEHAVSLAREAIRNAHVGMSLSIDPGSNKFMLKLEVVCEAIRYLHRTRSFAVWRDICRQIASEKIKDKSRLQAIKTMLAYAADFFSGKERKIVKSMLSRLK